MLSRRYIQIRVIPGGSSLAMSFVIFTIGTFAFEELVSFFSCLHHARDGLAGEPDSLFCSCALKLHMLRIVLKSPSEIGLQLASMV